MSNRKSTKIQPKNVNINNTKYTFFDDNSCREKRKNNCASTSLVSETELSELSERKSHGDECDVPDILAAEAEEICIKSEELLEQKVFLSLKIKNDTDSKPGNARNEKQSEREPKPISSLSEEKLLELRKKRTEKQRRYRKKKEIGLSEEEILKLRQENAQLRRENRRRKESALSTDELLKLRKQNAQQRSESRKRHKIDPSSLCEEMLLKIRKQNAERQRQYRKRKIIELTSISKDELLKVRYKRAQRQRQYRERLHKEGKFFEMRDRYTARQRNKRLSERNQTIPPWLTFAKDEKLEHENASSRNEEEGKELEMWSWDTENKLVAEQPMEKDFPTLTLEKVLELRWEKVKQNYFTRFEKENGIAI